jgi:selenocysteine lyase/cysteine desulfurase
MQIGQQAEGPYVANTHTESNITGTYITNAYHEAKSIIKNHVHANEDDIIIFDGFGMTGAINKFQRLIGIKHMDKKILTIKERPIIFVTHMEHHSNYLSWLETAAEVVTIRPDANGAVDYSHLEEMLKLHKQRHIKIGAFTACSNVTGRKTDYHLLAKLMHQYGGICLVDFY